MHRVNEAATVHAGIKPIATFDTLFACPILDASHNAATRFFNTYLGVIHGTCLA